MNKTILIVIGAFLAVGLLVALAGMYKFNYLASQPGYDVDGNKVDAVEVVSDPKNATYIIEGESVTLLNGLSEMPAAPDSATLVITRYFGNELQIDLNDDGREDTVFLLTQETGGSGTFFYVVAALNTEAGWQGSQALFLGDRIAPQTTEESQNPAHKNVIVVNYAERSPGAAMTEAPSVGKSLWLKFDPASMSFGEVVQDFAGEANPDMMSLGQKPWTWVRTTYNNDTELLPNQPGDFTLNFNPDGLVVVTTDCNSMNGPYEVDGNQIKFGEMATTRMYCEGSKEQDFAAMLTGVQSFFFSTKGELIFELKFDSGSAIFR